MPRPIGTIGETKLKILALIHHNDLHQTPSYGYNIWLSMKHKFYTYMEDGDLRNVYRHLKELNNLGLIEKKGYQSVKGAPKRQHYTLTEKGGELKQKFEKYLKIISAKHST